MFQLRCDAPAEGEAGSSEPRDAQEVGDLRHLQELFSRSFERGVVEAVYDAQGGSLAATSAALLAISADCSRAGPASSSAAAESNTSSKGKPRQAWWASVAAWQWPAAHRDVHSDAPLDFARTSTLPGEPAEITAAALPSCPPSDSLYCASGSCAWSLLPAEVQRQVYARLSAHDLALCARTSREFAAHVAERRSTVRTLILPPGVPDKTGNKAYHNSNHAEMSQHMHACLGSSAG